MGVKIRKSAARAILFLVGASAAGVLLLLIHISNTSLEATLYEIKSRRLPAAFDGFCIVQISDLHDSQFGHNQSSLLSLVREARPDLIAITGDLVDAGLWRTRYSPGLESQLVGIAPVYFVTGNHEIDSDHKPMLPEILELLEKSGVQVLRGRTVLIHRKGESIAVSGIDDLEASIHEGGSETVVIDRWVKALKAVHVGIDRELFTVLLSHRPQLFSHYVDAGFDLVLTGHAHGGQIRLPFIGALFAPDQGFLPPYTSGAHIEGRTTMIVSRGLGSTHVHIRFLNRPEIVVVRLQKE